MSGGTDTPRGHWERQDRLAERFADMSDEQLHELNANAFYQSRALAAQIRALEDLKREQDTLADDTMDEYLRRDRNRTSTWVSKPLASKPKTVYYICPGAPKACIGSGVKTEPRNCPNCGQECVPWPEADQPG